MRIKLALALIATSSLAYAKDGAYISANVGINSAEAKMNGVTEKTDIGFRGGIAFGLNVGDSFAVEYNLDHKSNNIKDKSPSKMFNATFHFVNGYFFVPHSISSLQALKPYVGAGIGYGYLMMSSPSASGASTSLDGVMVQGLLGAKYELSETFDAFADLSYGHGNIQGVEYKPYSLRLGGAFKF